MVNSSTLAKIQGKDVVTFMRLWKDRATASAALIPYQTGMTFGVSRDGDSTATKDGALSTQGALEVDFSVDFVNNTSVVADQALDAAISGERTEEWRVNRARRNAASQCEAWYRHGTIPQDPGENDSAHHLTRSFTFSLCGHPKHGWGTSPAATDEPTHFIIPRPGRVEGGA